jgi:hypothetical protein
MDGCMAGAAAAIMEGRGREKCGWLAIEEPALSAIANLLPCCTITPFLYSWSLIAIFRENLYSSVTH